MSTFSVKDGHFWLDDQPQLIQAGEFHYFRTPVDQWAHRLGLLRDAGFNTVAVYIPWLWHQLEADQLDVDGHSHPMRDLAGFLDLAASMGLFIIARPGPYIMAETINEGIPPWVFREFPQVAFVDQTGKSQNIVSYLHPDFLGAVEGWYQAVFEVLTPRQITHGGKIIMVQLDNEMGMLQWVRNMVDLNPDTLQRFADDLRGRYGDALRQRYPVENLVAYLGEAIQQTTSPAVMEDYRRFYRRYLRDYATFLLECARKNGLDVPPVANIHGFGNGGKTFPIGLSQLVEVMEIPGMVSATDVYPIHIGEGNFHQLILVNEMTKALQIPEQALFSIEFQAGGNLDFGGSQTSLYDLHSRLCISVGMRAINHYLFFDGENDPILSPTKRHNWGHPVRKDGTLRRHYARYPKLSRVLRAYGESLVRAQPVTVTTIGFILDYFMTEVNHVGTRPATDILTHQRDVVLFDFLARGLALTHRPFDAVEVTRAELNVQQIPLLWLMMEKQCDAATQQKLVDYVYSGGNLVIVGRMCDETFDHVPCTILQDALGIEQVISEPAFQLNHLRIFDYEDVPVSFVQTYQGQFDEVFATTASGESAGVMHRVGSGKVMILGAALPTNTLEDLDILEQMANRMGCVSLFQLSDWADVRLSDDTQGQYLFVNHYQDDPLETVIAYRGNILFDGHAIRLPARRGAILPLGWQVAPGIVVEYCTSEIIEIQQETEYVILKTDQQEFHALLHLDGYRCETGQMKSERVSVQGTNGMIVLTRI